MDEQSRDKFQSEEGVGDANETGHDGRADVQEYNHSRQTVIHRISPSLDTKMGYRMLPLVGCKFYVDELVPRSKNHQSVASAVA